MQVQIRVSTLRRLSKALGTSEHLLGASSWRYREAPPTDVVKVEFSELSLPDLLKMRLILKEEEENTRILSQYINALEEPESKNVPAITLFPQLLETYLQSQKHPWLFSNVNGSRLVAFLPYKVELRHTEHRGNNSHEYAVLTLVYNSKFVYDAQAIVINPMDVMGRTVSQVLAHKGLVVASDELLADYEKQVARFQKFGTKQAEQFLVRNTGKQARDRGFWWDSADMDLSPTGRPTKAVLDNGKNLQDRSRVRIPCPIFRNKTHLIPEHPVLRVFSLLHHEYVWVPVMDMREYVYEEGIIERLVLPSTHTRLISALVSNLDVLRHEAEAEDRSRTIRNKARSSIILAKGPAGTGKTLTAEVYSEQIKRPLYEIHSGQLGVTPEEVENNLIQILGRSIELNMPLLINEADVFIQARGNDMHQNAVVSVFLRLFEYHDGLVFLTTNRATDIDDAFLNRCLCVISYTTPAERERYKLWAMLLKEFNVSLTARELEDVVHTFPAIVGRDIQNLIRLTSRVCAATDMEFNLQALKDNAVFRDIAVIEVARKK